MVRKNIGGKMLAALFGTGTIAYFVVVFFIAPLLGFTNYAFNILTVITGLFTFQTTSIVFLGVWGLIYTGYLGVSFRGGRR